MKLQERDYFFRHLMSKIEHTVEMQKSTKKLAHHGIIVIAHSMGKYNKFLCSDRVTS